MGFLLALLLVAQTQDPAPVTTTTERGSALHLQVSGHLDLHYLYRSGEIDQAGAFLNSLAPSPAGSDTFWSGRMSGNGIGIGIIYQSPIFFNINQYKLIL